MKFQIMLPVNEHC